MKAPITAIPHAFYIRPAPGWLELLHEEVMSIVTLPLQKYKYEPKVTLLKGVVKLHRCDWRQGLEVLLRLNTAHDFEWMVLESKCTKWSEVDAILKRVPWDDILPSRDIPVHVSTDAFKAFSTSSGKLRENLCNIAGVQHVPEGGKVRFKIELRGEHLRLFVSLAGEPLYKRGYKVDFSATAPLPEHQAAACTRWILAAEKNDLPISSIFVPFAGSGTFGFEALNVLSGSGPGAFSRSYSCELFPCTPTPTMGFLRKKISDKLALLSNTPVVLNDFHPEALKMLRENVAAFPKKELFEIVEGDFFEIAPRFPEVGRILFLLNPPYGDRLAKDSNISALYSELGKKMRDYGQRYKTRMIGGCLCPDDISWKHFLNDLKIPHAETHHFTHGGKEMRIVRWTY